LRESLPEAVVAGSKDQRSGVVVEELAALVGSRKPSGPGSCRRLEHRLDVGRKSGLALLVQQLKPWHGDRPPMEECSRRSSSEVERRPTSIEWRASCSHRRNQCSWGGLVA
jgi:hypothetical protein